MTTDQNDAWFWNLIQECIPEESGYSIEQHKARLLTSLAALSDEDLFKFAPKFEDFYQASYAPNLWNAGYIISNCMGDDSFSDFRRSIIAFGKVVYERSLADPEYLAAFPLTEFLVKGETFSYLLHETLEKRMDEDAVLDAMEGIYRRLPDIDASLLIDDPEMLKTKFPRLFEKFWDYSWDKPD